MNHTNGHVRTFEPHVAPAPVRYLWQLYLHCLIGFLVVVAVVVLTFSTQETQRQSQELLREIRRERQEDLDRAKLIENVRRRQNVIEADLLLYQEKNLKLAKQLNLVLESQK